MKVPGTAPSSVLLQATEAPLSLSAIGITLLRHAGSNDLADSIGMTMPPEPMADRVASAPPEQTDGSDAPGPGRD